MEQRRVGKMLGVATWIVMHFGLTALLVWLSYTLVFTPWYGASFAQEWPMVFVGVALATGMSLSLHWRHIR